MTRAERIAADADEAVSRWATLSAEDRAALTADITLLDSGGAMAAINGVDVWAPSWRHALAEVAAHRAAHP